MKTFPIHAVEAARALRRHPLRTGLTLLGIVVGVMAIIVVIAIGSGSRQAMMERIQSLGGSLLIVQPGNASRGAADLGSGSRPSLDIDDARAIRREVAGVTAAAASIFGRQQAIRGNRNRLTTVQGITADYLVAREWPVAAGRPLSARDDTERGKVALLGATVAAALFPQDDALGSVIRIGNTPVVVIGVLETKGQSAGGADQDDKIMIPLSTAMARVLGPGRAIPGNLDYIMIKAGQPDDLERIAADVRALLRYRHRLTDDAADDFRVGNLAELQKRKREATEVLTFWLTAVASVALIVGAISVTNIMLVAVAERKREIGLRLAVGARPRDVRNQFLAEALLLGLGGGLLGVVCGTVAAWAITHWSQLPFVIPPGAVLLAVGAAALVGVAAGIFPAVSAASLSPMEALRSE